MALLGQVVRRGSVLEWIRARYIAKTNQSNQAVTREREVEIRVSERLSNPSAGGSAPRPPSMSVPRFSFALSPPGPDGTTECSCEPLRISYGSLLPLCAAQTL